MSKMVNRLALNQKIIRRFVNDSDDEEVEDYSCGSDIEVLEANVTKLSENSLHSSTSDLSKNSKYTNYKIIVRNCGQSVERFVDLNGDNNPFILNDALDQLMECKDLNQMTAALRKSLSTSDTSVRQLSPQRPKSKGNKKKDKQRPQNETKDFEVKVKELESDGIRYLKAKKKVSFKCLVCDIKVIGIQLATDHCKSDFHLKKKFGDDLKGIDALFTIDSEAIGDFQIAIARRRELKRIDSNDKQRYLEHGIRLKDGFGSNAYICSKCGLCFGSLREVEQHSKQQLSKTSEPSADTPTKSPNSKVDQKLHSEGIKATESSDGSKFYCIFCNIYFECKRLAVSHVSDSRHKRQKRGENLNEMDTRFTIESNRIDELDVAFARKTILKSLPMKTKLEFIDQSIRLQDGIGCNAFFCQKCNLPIETMEEITGHITSHN